MRNFGMSMICFWMGYITVTALRFIHTIFNITILHMSTMKDGHGRIEGYEKTKPWHPLCSIIIFTLFGWLYLRNIVEPDLTEALVTGGIWAGVCIIFDLIAWVLIRHPCRFTFKEFYIDYQPWLTLIYIAIFCAPVIAHFLLRR